MTHRVMTIVHVLCSGRMAALPRDVVSGSGGSISVIRLCVTMLELLCHRILCD